MSIKSGVWHQFGHQSQTQALEHLAAGLGVGCIISPRHLGFSAARDYSAQYAATGAQVLVDPQFFNPASTSKTLKQYPFAAHRGSVTTLRGASMAALDELSTALETTNRDLGASAVVAPAVIVGARQPDTLELNRRLYAAAKRVGDAMGVPTLATIAIGNSATRSAAEVDYQLNHQTAQRPDGWYLVFEFKDERVPTDKTALHNYASTLLSLARTGRPVLNAYSGLLSPLALAFGASAVCTGHNQKLWHFRRSTWQPSTTQGGGGDAPPRFFSAATWGTLICPDELDAIPEPHRTRVLTTTRFSDVLSTSPRAEFAGWTRHAAGKHLAHIVGLVANRIASQPSVRDRLAASTKLLADAVAMSTELSIRNILVGSDSQPVYQSTWLEVLNDAPRRFASDYLVLDLL